VGGWGGGGGCGLGLVGEERSRSVPGRYTLMKKGEEGDLRDCRLRPPSLGRKQVQ